jgi:hypothetical protein
MIKWKFKCPEPRREYENLSEGRERTAAREGETCVRERAERRRVCTAENEYPPSTCTRLNADGHATRRGDMHTANELRRWDAANKLRG